MTNLDNAGLAFGLVVCAGLATAVGAAFVFAKNVVKLASKPVLAAGLGFSGGVMIYVSFIEIFQKSVGAFTDHGYGGRDAHWSATLCLFAGMAILRLISILVHRLDPTHHCCDECDDQAPATTDVENDPADVQPTQAKGSDDAKAKAELQLQQMGINTALAIAIHNFPEGLATFVATLADPAVGVTLAVAIAIHNIPEGLCVALPIYYATGSRMKGFLWALASGLSEPVGAFIGWLIIKSTGDDMSQLVYGVLFGLVGGMMIMIVILELLPTAYRYDPTDRFVTTSVAAGMLVMALSLCLFLA